MPDIDQVLEEFDLKKVALFKVAKGTENMSATLNLMKAIEKTNAILRSAEGIEKAKAMSSEDAEKILYDYGACLRKQDPTIKSVQKGFSLAMAALPALADVAIGDGR